MRESALIALCFEPLIVYSVKLPVIFKIPPVVSKDPQIHQLLAQHDVHVVISSGGLSAIVDLQSSLDTEWEIPVTVTAKDEEKGTRLGGASDRCLYYFMPIVTKHAFDIQLILISLAVFFFFFFFFLLFFLSRSLCD